MSMTAILHGVSRAFLDECLTDSDLVHELQPDFSDENPDCLDMDKSWGAITFMLGGEATGFPDEDNLLSQAIISGETIDDEQDLGMSPAFYLTAEKVTEIATQLTAMSEEAFKSRYQPEKMADIYPLEWQDNAEDFDYLWQYFNLLRKFYTEQAEKNHAIISYIF